MSRQEKPTNAREFRRAAEELKEQIDGCRTVVKAMNDYVDGLKKLKKEFPESVDDKALRDVAKQVDAVNMQMSLVDNVITPLDTMVDFMDPQDPK